MDYRAACLYLSTKNVSVTCLTNGRSNDEVNYLQPTKNKISCSRYQTTCSRKPIHITRNNQSNRQPYYVRRLFLDPMHFSNLEQNKAPSTCTRLAPTRPSSHLRRNGQMHGDLYASIPERGKLSQFLFHSMQSIEHANSYRPKRATD